LVRHSAMLGTSKMITSGKCLLSSTAQPQIAAVKQQNAKLMADEKYTKPAAGPYNYPSLNISLNRSVIAPQHASIRNAPYANIHESSYAAVEPKTKARIAKVDAKSIKTAQKYSTGDHTFTADCADIKQENINQLRWDISHDYISDLPLIYTFDAAILLPEARPSHRIITDNGVTALFLKNMTVETTTKPKEFEYAFTGLAVGAYELPDEQAAIQFDGPKLSDFGLKAADTNFQIFDNSQENPVFMLSDNQDHEAILTATAQYINDSGAQLVVPSDIYMDRENGMTVLINHKNNSSGAIDVKNLQDAFGMHHHIFTPEAISRVWKGFRMEYKSIDEAQKAGFPFTENDLIEDFGGKIAITHAFGDDSNFSIQNVDGTSSVDRVVICIDDPSKSIIPDFAEINAKIATKLYATGVKGFSANGDAICESGTLKSVVEPKIHPLVNAMGFESLVKATRYFVMNSALSKADSQKHLKGATKGFKPVKELAGWTSATTVKNSKAATNLNAFIGEQFTAFVEDVKAEIDDGNHLEDDIETMNYFFETMK